MTLTATNSNDTLNAQEQKRLNQAHSLHREGQHTAAEEIYLPLVQNHPDNIEVLSAVGLLYLQNNHFDVSVRYLEHAEVIFTQRSETAENAAQHADLLYNLGLAYHNLERFDEAIASQSKALELNPQHPHANYMLGKGFLAQGNAERAIAAYKNDIELNQREDAYIEIATIYAQRQQWGSSSRYSQEALRINPQSENAWSGLATAIIALNNNQPNINLQELEKVMAIVQQMHAHNPKSWKANMLAAQALGSIGDDEGAVEQYQHTLNLNPGFAPAQSNLGLIQLRLGQFTQGWQNFSARTQFEERLSGVDSDFANWELPQWQGDVHAGLRLLIAADGGIGDQILFGQLVPELIEQGVHVTLTCTQKILPLLQRSIPKAKLYARESALPPEVLARAQYKIPLMDVARYLRGSFEQFDTNNSYLQPDPQQLTQCRQRYASFDEQIKVGIAWKSHSENNSGLKSTNLDDWLPILQTPGIQFFSIQYGEVDQDITRLRELGVDIIHDTSFDPFEDIDAALAQIATMDMVISVSNASVHMAGAVDVPTWVMIGTPSMWHWFNERTDSPWYNSVRLFRRSATEDWNPVIHIVADQLRAVMNNIASTNQAPESKPTNTNEEHSGVNDSIALPATAEEQQCLQQAMALHQSGQYQEAEGLYAQILQKNPALPDVQFLLGLLQLQAQKYEAAINAFDETIKLQPLHSDCHYRLGLAHMQLGHYQQAVAAEQQAVMQQPGNGDAHFALGLALAKLDLAQEAIDAFEKAIEIDPREDAYNELSNLYLVACDWEHAIFCASKATALNPTSEIAYANIATALIGRNTASVNINLEDIENIMKIVTIMQANNPQSWKAHMVAGEAMTTIQEDELAIAHYQELLKINPDFAPAKTNLGVLLMRHGRFKEGWPLLCARADFGETLFGMDTNALQRCNKPHWQGQVSADMRLLVAAEQGIGDQFLYGQLITELQDQGVEVVCTLDKKIQSLMQRSIPEATILAKQNEVPDAILDSVDYKATLFDLGRYLRDDPSKFAVNKPYLRPDPNLVAEFVERYAPYDDVLKVGISWKSSSPTSGHLKSTPIADWLAVLRVPGVQFFSIQYGDIDAEIEHAKRLSGADIIVDDSVVPFAEIERAAAQIAALDLVISVSNASVHMAASMGKPVWVLLGFRPLWHWFCSTIDGFEGADENSPWYTSARLFRQQTLADWTPCIQRIADELGQLAARKRSESRDT